MPKQFTHESWETLLSQTIEQIRSLSSVKGAEYAGDFDRLANFRRNAQDMELTMEQVWRVYAGKHWDSINTWIKDRATGQDRARSESMLGRADDLIVYSILLKAMMIEAGEGQQLIIEPSSMMPKLPLALTVHINERTCDHQWHRFDRHTDTCVFCNTMRAHRSRG